MENFIDVPFIMQVALFMVGITQCLKQFFELKSRKLKILLAICVGATGGVLLFFVPSWIFNTILGISVGVVFYDYILKGLEKMFSGEYTYDKFDRPPRRKNIEK